MPYVDWSTFISYQIAIGTDDVYKTAEAIKLCGGQIILDPGPLPGINTKITACLDPEGWKSVADNVLAWAKDFIYLDELRSLTFSSCPAGLCW